MRRLQNMLGTSVLFGFSLLTTWLLTKWPMSLDRALSFTVLAVLAQVRWFQEDKSPLGKSAP